MFNGEDLGVRLANQSPRDRPATAGTQLPTRARRVGLSDASWSKMQRMPTLVSLSGSKFKVLTTRRQASRLSDPVIDSSNDDMQLPRSVCRSDGVANPESLARRMV